MKGIEISWQQTPRGTLDEDKGKRDDLIARLDQLSFVF